MTDAKITFYNDAPNDRFVIEDADGLLGFISYEYADGVYDLQHTVMQPASKGRGLGTSLATQTFDWIRQHNNKLIPTCPFLPKVLEKFPEYNDLVASK